MNRKNRVVKIIDNYTFYQGYEGEPEIILAVPNSETVHIWEGYFEDIYGAPSLDGKGWIGFTRDYQQMTGAFSGKGEVEIDPTEYLEDLMQYKSKTYEYEETAQLFELIAMLLKKACEAKVMVRVKVV